LKKNSLRWDGAQLSKIRRKHLQVLKLLGKAEDQLLCAWSFAIIVKEYLLMNESEQ
jgi:hypothetical protein